MGTCVCLSVAAFDGILFPSLRAACDPATGAATAAVAKEPASDTAADHPSAISDTPRSRHRRHHDAATNFRHFGAGHYYYNINEHVNNNNTDYSNTDIRIDNDDDDDDNGDVNNNPDDDNEFIGGGGDRSFLKRGSLIPVVAASPPSVNHP